MNARLLLAGILVLLVLLIPGWAAHGEPVCPPTDTPEIPTDEPTGTPWLQTQYPSETPWDTPTSAPTETPYWTDTPGITPDPSPSATVTPGKPDREKPTPTVIETLPVTGGGMPPNVAIGLTAIGIVVLLAVAWLARAGRRV